MSPFYKTAIFIVLSFFFFAFCKGQTASFSFQTANGLYCTPVTVNFTQAATGNPSGYSWSFGNGAFSNAANPSATYSSPGTYTVTLTAIYENNTAQSSQTITINPAITVALSADRNYICIPGVINFTATPGGSVSGYTYDFGDGSAPVTTSNTTVSHNYTAFGTYTASVTATSPFGCTATNTLAIQVQPPPVSGSIFPTFGCVPATANFNASVNLPTGGSVTNYAWVFGDGATFSGNSASTSHAYTTAGTYSPSVTITTNEGCSNSFSFSPVAYGTPPTNLQANVVKPIICASETGMFVATATNANMYVWKYGDGFKDSIPGTTAQHKYDTLGIMNVTITPYYNGCPGQTQNLTIEIVGVIAGFSYANTCMNRNIYSFTDTSKGNVSAYSWTFGDGSPVVTTANPVHTYPVSGTFPTRLLVTDNITGCQDTRDVNIYTARPSLTNTDSAICRSTASVFTINNNYGNPANVYTWNVLGQTFVNSTNPFGAPGNVLGLFQQNNVIISYGAQSCPDTIALNRPILVRGPLIDFNFPSPVCTFSQVNITNNSAPFIATDTVRLWYWNYGFTPINDSSYQPQTQAYGAPGIYNIKLAGIDKNGCKDSLVKPIRVDPVPYLKVVPQRDTLCLGEQATLIAFHSEPLTWSNSATLSCANCDTTIASPTMTTNYVATITNSFGCITRDTSRVLVYTPFTATVRQDNIFICAGDSAFLSAGPPDKVIRWSPAVAITDTTIYNPVVYPTSNTSYTALLTDSVGCFSSSVSVDVDIKTTPTVNAGPDVVLPYANTLQLSPAYTGTILSYQWSPGTNLSCTNCPTTVVTALATQLYIIKVTSDSGCVARDSIKVIVECKDANLYIPTAFTPNGDGRNDYIYPLTRGISIITRFTVFNRYGQTVFTRSNFAPNIRSLGWDGKIQNVPQDNSTYVYIMEAVCDQGQKLLKKGSFVMVR